MKCTSLMMFVYLSLELLLIAFIGLCEAAPRVRGRDAPTVGNDFFSVLGSTMKPLNSTTMPNHLPEERFRGTPRSALTPAPAGISTGMFSNRVQFGNATTHITTTVAVNSSKSQPSADTKNVLKAALKKTTESVRAAPFTETTSSSSLTSAFTTLTKAVAAVREKSSNSESSISHNTQLASTADRQEPPCNCSGEGVQDPEDCDRASGQCSCLPGYMGPQCDECEDGHFNNGSAGCLPCACDSFGSVGPLCDSSGTCTCRRGVYGAKCDDCQPGYFRFSSAGCQPCQCHNHSNYCHPQSGICLNCQGNTKGPGCEECKYNFYRRPGTALTDICTPCPCSTVTSTGSCHIEPDGQPVCDQCRPEYEGANCDRCRDGFYNSDSICLPCNCSGNADPHSSPRLCNPDTGRCLSCVNHTAGPHCERCAPGYTGDALAHTCTLAVVIPDLDFWVTTTAPTTAVVFTPGVPLASRTMSARVNTTSVGAAATTQALLTSLNSTVTEVSWTQFNIVVLAVIIAVVVLLTGFVGGVYTYREYRNRKLNAPFWTIELKEDNISFSSYHDSLPNADVSGLLEDEPAEVAPNGQLSLTAPMNIYRA